MDKPYYANIRTDVLNLLARSHAARLLEVGGGDFPTLLELRERVGGEAWGVDIRPSQAPLDRMLVGSVTGSEIRKALVGQAFDVIMANDVLEHVEDTEAFLAVIKQHLAPDGDVLLSVPNVRCLKAFYQIFVRGTFPRQDAGLFDRTHVRWFCRSDIEQLAARAGLKVVQHRYVGRFARGPISSLKIGEFLALHNIFRLKHM